MSTLFGTVSENELDNINRNMKALASNQEQIIHAQKIIRLEQFIHTYFQFQMILDEIRLMTQDAIVYLENLKSELNMLSMHHLSTNIISPKDLRKLFTVVESKLPLQ